MKLTGLIVVGLAAFCVGTNVQQCKGSGRSIENLSDKVKVGTCKKGPCRLRKDTTIPLSFKFTPEREVTKLVNTVNANILGIPFPFPGTDGVDACTNIFKNDQKVSCPLKAGEEYEYRAKIDVLKIYPRVKTVVHWGLTTPEGDVLCFEVPARITN